MSEEVKIERGFPTPAVNIISAVGRLVLSFFVAGNVFSRRNVRFTNRRNLLRFK